VSETYIAIVLDSSGSMAMNLQATINAFNEQVQTIKFNAAKEGIETYVSFYTFGNSQVKEHFYCEPADRLEELTTETYVPYGDTPLFDGLHHAITRLKERIGVAPTDLVELVKQKMEGTDTTALVVVISDGDENSSSTPKSWVAEQIQTLTDCGRWTFTYAGANQDVKKICEDLNFNPNNVTAFAATADGFQALSHAHVSGLSNYYATRSAMSRGEVDTMATMSFYSPAVNNEEEG
jgi:hypothetical protein